MSGYALGDVITTCFGTRLASPKAPRQCSHQEHGKATLLVKSGTGTMTQVAQRGIWVHKGLDLIVGSTWNAPATKVMHALVKAWRPHHINRTDRGFEQWAGRAFHSRDGKYRLKPTDRARVTYYPHWYGSPMVWVVPDRHRAHYPTIGPATSVGMTCGGTTIYPYHLWHARLVPCTHYSLWPLLRTMQLLSHPLGGKRRSLHGKRGGIVGQSWT